MSDGPHEYVDYMHNHYHLFSDLEGILKMKKDKTFCKRKFFHERGNASWCINVVSRQLMFVHLNGNVCIQKKDAKQLRKFIKALKKGLRRLERG